MQFYKSLKKVFFLPIFFQQKKIFFYNAFQFIIFGQNKCYFSLVIVIDDLYIHFCPKGYF